VAALRDEFGARIHIGKGIEVCYQPERMDFILEFLAAHTFDVVLLSIHWAFGKAGFMSASILTRDRSGGHSCAGIWKRSAPRRRTSPACTLTAGIRFTFSGIWILPSATRNVIGILKARSTRPTSSTRF
jgi:hypothetical protein